MEKISEFQKDLKELIGRIDSGLYGSGWKELKNDLSKLLKKQQKSNKSLNPTTKDVAG